MRLLVTGVSGLIGNHVATLAAADTNIELVVSARRQPDEIALSSRFIPADLSNAEEAAALVRSVQPTHIIHTAWETRQPTYWSDVANLDWIVSATRMARAFAEIGGKRFLQLGSCAEYDWSHGMCIEGVTPDRPKSRYGMAKLAAFHAIEAASYSGFEAVEARIFFVFGPGENPARLIPFICRSHLSGITPDLGSGRQWRDLLYVEDAAEALFLLLQSEGLVGVVNIGATDPQPLSCVASTLARLAGAEESGLGRRAEREGDPKFLIAASDRLRSTGWEPRWSLERSLAAAFQWWQHQQS